MNETHYTLEIRDIHSDYRETHQFPLGQPAPLVSDLVHLSTGRMVFVRSRSWRQKDGHIAITVSVEG